MRSDSFPVPVLPALAVSLVLGLGLARVLPVDGEAPAWLRPCAWAGLPTAFAAMGVSIRGRRPPGRATFWATGLFFLLAGLISGWMASPPSRGHPALEPFYDRPRTLFAATVDSPAEFLPGRIQLPLRIDEALVSPVDSSGPPGLGMPVGVTILLTLRTPAFSSSSWLPGDRLLVRLTVKRFRNFEVPGGFDYSRYQAEKGLFGRAYLSDGSSLLRLAPENKPFPGSLASAARRDVDGFRQSALRWFTDSLPPDTASFLAAMLIGYQKLISPDWNDHLNRTGLNHLLSISGLHLGLVALAVFWFACRVLRWCAPTILGRTPDQHFAVWPALAASLAYAFVSGFGSAPVWRSLIMLALCFGALLLHRGSDAVSSLSAAALLILLVDPNSLGQLSFQLSFTCMLGLFFVYPRIRRWKIPRIESDDEAWKIPRKLLAPFIEALRVSVAVSIVVLPLTVLTFHGVSLALFAANLVVVPVVGFLVLPLGLAAVALFTVSPWAASPLLLAAGWITGLCQNVILWFSGFSWAFFWVGELGIASTLLYYAALAAMLSPLAKKTRAAVVLALAVAAVIFPRAQQLLMVEDGAGLRLTVLDVGQGTANFLRFPDGKTMLVDGGGFPDRSYDVGRQVVAPFLWAKGVRKLDVVALSHDHPDHADGLRFILSHFNVGELWESGLTANPSGVSTAAEIARRRGIPVRGIMETEGRTVLGGCEVRALHPTRAHIDSGAAGDDLNRVSVVLRIDHGATRLILPGDIDQPVENLLAAGEPAFRGETLLVAAHHGSRRSTGDRFLDGFHPERVIISCGQGNSYGFPAREVLERCGARGIEIFRTDIEGTVLAESDGTRWRVAGTVPGRGSRPDFEETDSRQASETGDEDFFPGGHSRKPPRPRNHSEVDGRAASP